MDTGLLDRSQAKLKKEVGIIQTRRDSVSFFVRRSLLSHLAVNLPKTGRLECKVLRIEPHYMAASK